MNRYRHIIQSDTVINQISDKIIETQGEEDNIITLLKHQLTETKSGIDNLMNAIEKGIITETTKSRLLELEKQKRILRSDWLLRL